MKFTLMFVNLFLPYLMKVYATVNSKCHYEVWDWNTHQRKMEHKRKIIKLRSELNTNELGRIKGCTICEEDQVEIMINPQTRLKFKICKQYETQVRIILKELAFQKFPIQSIVGYRPGYTRGPFNQSGHRTQLSHHSFGVAIDINSEFNGLYDHCFKFDHNCVLIKGGEYRPTSAHLGVITKDSSAYKTFQKYGWKWGGEMQGKQKDFMHFSITGE